MKNKLIKSCVSNGISSLIICIWVFSAFTYANKVKAQNLDHIQLSIEVNQASLSQVIDQIQKKTLFTFFFQDELLSEVNQKISLDVKQMPLREILKLITTQL